MSRRTSAFIAATRALFWVGAAMWIGVAVGLAWGAISAGAMPRSVSLGLAGAMTAAAVVMAYLGARCCRGRSMVDAAAVVVSVGNIILTFTDEVGAYDILYACFAAVLLGVLVTAILLRRHDVMQSASARHAGDV